MTPFSTFSNGTIEDFEHSIAHEATHGLLVYARGYCLVEPTRSLDPGEIFSLGTIGTMLDDVVVNKTISQEGFAPFAGVYLDMVRKETKAARRHDIGLYKNTGPDLPTQKRFMIYRYIAAWSAVRYYHLNLADKNTLTKFQKTFARSYKDVAAEANKIRSLFEEYNIFTPKGHAILTEKVLSLWDLIDAVSIRYQSGRE